MMASKNVDVMTLNKKFVKDLIETYRNLPALWKVKCPEYRIKDCKTEAYNILVKKCREYVHDADKEFVRNKINSLRTSFRKEYKKVLRSKMTALTPSHVHKPHLWYYDLLMFTVNQDEEEGTDGTDVSLNEEETVVSFQNLEDEQEQEEEGEEEDIVSFELKKEEDYLSFTPATPEELTAFTPEAPKRKRLDETAHKKTSLHEQHEDIYDAIGRNVAHKLRGMTEKQRIIAEKIISDVMYHGQMETLTVNSHLSLDKTV